MPTANEPRQREIRVFISSTFRDMQEEREELVKQIFPQLRRLCESRGVTWGEVDLRWGIPDEARAEGKVLPLCLAEIERCRPYFIGLLGERYGWVPEEIPGELLEAQPWLTKYPRESVTSLEILHGVLLNRDMPGHAFFYFRDPAYADQHAGFIEEDPTRRNRLVALKDDIRKSGLPVAESFATPKQLGEWVLRDFRAVIENLYPESSIPDPLDRAAADHQAYAASRRRVYIDRPEYTERLDAHAAGDGAPLAVLGESGGGKSALLANWVHRWGEQHPETPAIVHFIGAAPDSADWMAMLRRLLGEFQRRFSIQIEIPDQPAPLRMALANALNMLAARGRMVLVLDALNQIEDRDGAPDLVWLPLSIPANVRLIVSTLPGRAMDDLRKRAWPMLTVEPLKPAERETLIDGYLKQFAKQLGLERRRRIAAAPQSGNCLYLTTLLNELRQFGSYEELDQRIDWYLQAPDPAKLYGKVIRRWQQDYTGRDPGCQNIVRETLVRLWAARRGLTETELLEGLGTEGRPLPRAFWSPLFLAAGDALVSRGGLLTFAHDFLRAAVHDAYLPTQDQRRCAHRALGTYFESKAASLRRVDELPWQWQEAEDWERLFEVLCEPATIELGWDSNEYMMMQFWSRLQENSSHQVNEAFFSLGTLLGSPDIPIDRIWGIAARMVDLLSHFDDGDRSSHSYDLLAEHWREVGDLGNLEACLGNKGLLCVRMGRLDEAHSLFLEQEAIARKAGKAEAALKAVCARAGVSAKQDKGADGVAALEGIEALVRETHDASLLCDYEGVLGACLLVSREFARADDRFREQQRWARIIGRKDIVLAAICNRALALHTADKKEGALECAREAGRIAREIRSEKELLEALIIQIKITLARSEWRQMLDLCDEAEGLARKLGNPENLFVILAKRSAVLGQQFNRFEEALTAAQEAHAIAVELGLEDEILASRLVTGIQQLLARHKMERTDMDLGVWAVCQSVVDNVAATHNENVVRVLQALKHGQDSGTAYSRGDLVTAIRLGEQGLQCIDNAPQVGLLRALIHSGLVAPYARSNEFGKAAACGRAALEWLAGDPRLKKTYATCMHDLGGALVNLREFDEGIGYMERAVGLLSEMPDEGDLTRMCRDNLERVRSARGRLEGKKAEKTSVWGRLFGG